MGSLKNCGRAAGEGGAGLELPTGEIRRGTIEFGPTDVAGKLRRGGQLEIPAQGGVKCEMKLIGGG